MLTLSPVCRVSISAGVLVGYQQSNGCRYRSNMRYFGINKIAFQFCDTIDMIPLGFVMPKRGVNHGSSFRILPCEYSRSNYR